MEKFKELHIICECYSPEHQFTLIKDPEEDEVWINIHLSDYQSFTQRLWIGLKYAFGYRSKYGDFDNIIISPDSQKKIIEFLNT